MNLTDKFAGEKEKLFNIAKNYKRDFLESNWLEKQDSFFSEYSGDVDIAEYGFENVSSFSERCLELWGKEDFSDQLTRVCNVAYLKGKNCNYVNNAETKERKENESNIIDDITVPDFVYVF